MKQSACDLLNRDFFRIADVVDIQMLALIDHHQQAIDKVINVSERSSLLAVALNGKRCGPGWMLRDEIDRPDDELRNHVFPRHIRPVHIVWPEDDGAFELLAA